MSGSNALNPFQVGRGIYNNLGFTKAVYHNLNEVRNDSFVSRTDQVGVYFLNGASSTRALETSVSGTPVITNTSTPSAGNVLVAQSATSAIWDDAPFAPLDSQYLLWPPGNTPADLELTNAFVLSNGTTTTVANDGTNVQVNLNTTLGGSSSINVPTITVDAKGRITNIINEQVPYTAWTAVAGTGVNTINSQTCAYTRYFDEVAVYIDIDFDTTNLASDPVVLDFTGLPIDPVAAQTSMNTAILLDSSNAVLSRGILYVDGTAGTLFFSSGTSTPAGVNAGVRLIGSLVYPPV